MSSPLLSSRLSRKVRRAVSESVVIRLHLLSTSQCSPRIPVGTHALASNRLWSHCSHDPTIRPLSRTSSRNNFQTLVCYEESISEQDRGQELSLFRCWKEFRRSIYPRSD